MYAREERNEISAYSRLDKSLDTIPPTVEFPFYTWHVAQQ